MGEAEEGNGGVEGIGRKEARRDVEGRREGGRPARADCSIDHSCEEGGGGVS